MSPDTTSEHPGRLQQRPDVCSMHRAGCTPQDEQGQQAGGLWQETKSSEKKMDLREESVSAFGIRSILRREHANSAAVVGE
jgi:hypothetical protein